MTMYRGLPWHNVQREGLVGLRWNWDANLFAAVRSVVGSAATWHRVKQPLTILGGCVSAQGKGG